MTPSIGRDNNDTLEVIMSEHTATKRSRSRSGDLFDGVEQELEVDRCHDHLLAVARVAGARAGVAPRKRVS
jgi:hypothetical protein